ncbi:MAG: S8 family peptidase [Paracoccaceae bacterium]
MKSRKSIVVLSFAGLLAACQHSNDQVASVVEQVSLQALTAYFVADFIAFEDAAAALRDLDSRYTVQDFSWSFQGSGTVYDSYSLAHARTEYAHAAGLTGAGQVISIIDTGFLTSHDEFTGKTISMPSAPNAPGVDDHGTSVASIAAGVAGSGQIIGVAPAADLQLGSFDSLGAMTAATQQAISLGAIVQNNSWGYNLNATSSDFQSAFSSTAGTNYINALQQLANTALIVFAASNDQNRTTADLMSGLPLVRPDLQASWLAVVDAVPVFSGDAIISATMISAGCLGAAPWCVAADGTVYAAQATSESDYAIAGGTSFAAPQVSGAVALLAEAFPSLSAQELRARVLASADNNFFTHANFVEFAPGVLHGFDYEFGHGFLNLKAALLPIGGSYVPQSSGGRLVLDGPVILGGGMVGDALSARLAAHDIIVVDGLGADFDMPANILTAEISARSSPLALIGELLAVDLDGTGGDPFHVRRAFSAPASGQALDMEFETVSVSILVPDRHSAGADYGLELSRKFELGRSDLRLGFSTMHEGDGFVGIQAMLPGTALSANHVAAIFDWGVPLGPASELRLSGSFGVARAQFGMSDIAMSAVNYNSLNLSYGARDVWGTGDRISVAIGLPQAVSAGSAAFILPVSRSDGEAQFDTADIALSPQHRQLDIKVSYGVPLWRNAAMLMTLVNSLNQGNIGGQRGTGAAIGFSYEF